MNIENINATLKLLRRVKDLEAEHNITLFQMDTWGNRLPASLQDLEEDLHDDARCQTAGCIAGWACVAAKNVIDRKKLTVEQFAEVYLDLSKQQSHSLFYADQTTPSLNELTTITTAQAIRALEDLRDNGVIRWNLIEEQF